MQTIKRSKTDSNYFHVFTAGEYPQGTVTAEDLARIAACYDPSVYEAPVWIGHPGSTTPEEPKAYGWVESLIAEDDKLYASFSHLDDDLIGMVKDRKYRRCSVEFGKLNYKPLKDKLYLVAIALTNRPAVAGLAPLEFSAPERNYKPEMVSGKILYTLLKRKRNFKKSKEKNKMEKLLAFANRIGVDLSGDTDENKLAEILEQEYTRLAEENTQFRNEAIDVLFKFALSEGKITPAEQENLKELAESNFTACRAYIEKIPSRQLFTRKVTTGGFTGHDNQKLMKDDGTKLTYNDILENPGRYSRILNDEEINALREESEFGIRN